jgi:general secretion pathway protein E
MSTIPSAHGERVVLRLLDTAAGQLHLTQLAMNEQVLAAYKKHLHSPHGIILVTGPTGSGKTTTLYAGLAEINETSRNILTIEDPVEYMLPGIGQTQVNPKVDMTFARGLRAILRQDPDVVMVGEIRDRDGGNCGTGIAHWSPGAVHTAPIRDRRDYPPEGHGHRTLIVVQPGGRDVAASGAPAVQRPQGAGEPNAAERELLRLDGRCTRECHHAKGCERCNGTVVVPHL